MVVDGFGHLNGQAADATGALALAELLVQSQRTVEVLYAGPDNAQFSAHAAHYRGIGIVLTRCVHQNE